MNGVPGKRGVLCALGFAIFAAGQPAGPSFGGPPSVSPRVDGVPHAPLLRPFAIRRALNDVEGLELEFAPQALSIVHARSASLRVHVPLSPDLEADLLIEPFEVTRSQTRFIIAEKKQQLTMPSPQVTLFRGRVMDDPASHAFLAVAPSGAVNGYVTLGDGAHFTMSRRASTVTPMDPVIVRRDSGRASAPEFALPCGTWHEYDRRVATAAATYGITVTHGPQVAFLAVDGDQPFVQLFPDATSAQEYIVMLVGAISDIYMRDLDVKLILDFARVWPDGGEPFGAHSLVGFAGYWNNNEDTTGLNLVHLLSGRRNLSYGGIAYVGGFCGGPTYGISGFLQGGFPTPVDDPDLGNWDVVVSAHEMGHNLGSYHTHDGYTPPIDECGSAGIWARSEILSYCHILPGGVLNIEMRFSSRVQNVIADEIAAEACLWFDCNDNGINDADDIATLFSFDLNANGVPDECEDCDSDGTRDDEEIAGGAADVDGNGVPDACEPDCNANDLPDEWETATGFAPDTNGNRVPDSCEPDCDADGTADFAEIAAAGSGSDIDRDSVPDSCVDCNSNGEPDWADVARHGHVYVTDIFNRVRVYHGVSGVAEMNLGAGLLSDPQDLVFGPDGQLYVASFNNHTVVRVDPDGGPTATFIGPGSGGLSGPAGLVFRANGNLLVSSNGTNEVLEYDGSTGTFVGAFVSAGSGGLSGPRDLAWDAFGQLLVATSANSVLRYAAADGSFLGTLITAGSGGLSGARQMVVRPDGAILIASMFADSVLAYHPSGAFAGQFNDGYPLADPTALAVGPNGNVYVVSHVNPIRIIEYDVSSGRYLRSFIRGDTALFTTSAIAFRPVTDGLDCNANNHPDECDIAEGRSSDNDEDGIPDECVESAAEPLQPCPNDFELATNGAGGERLSRFGCLAAPQPPAVAGGGTAIRVVFRTLLNTEPGDPDGASLCEPRALLATPPPSISQFEGQTRWLGAPAELLDETVPASPSYIAAPLVCSAVGAKIRDWTQAGLGATFGDDAMTDRIFFFDSAVVPCSVYEVSQCGDPLDEVTCSDPVLVFTSRLADVWPSFGPVGEPSFTDINALVNKFKGIPLTPGPVPSGGAPEWHALLSGNVVGNYPEVIVAKVGFRDIGVAVNAFKSISYSEQGPCDPDTATDNCGNPCSTAP